MKNILCTNKEHIELGNSTLQFKFNIEDIQQTYNYPLKIFIDGPITISQDSRTKSIPA